MSVAVAGTSVIMEQALHLAKNSIEHVGGSSKAKIIRVGEERAEFKRIVLNSWKHLFSPFLDEFYEK